MVALVDYFGGGFIAYVLVLLEVISVSYIYGTELGGIWINTGFSLQTIVVVRSLIKCSLIHKVHLNR